MAVLRSTLARVPTNAIKTTTALVLVSDCFTILFILIRVWLRAEDDPTRAACRSLLLLVHHQDKFTQPEWVMINRCAKMESVKLLYLLIMFRCLNYYFIFLGLRILQYMMCTYSVNIKRRVCDLISLINRSLFVRLMLVVGCLITILSFFLTFAFTLSVETAIYLNFDFKAVDMSTIVPLLIKSFGFIIGVTNACQWVLLEGCVVLVLVDNLKRPGEKRGDREIEENFKLKDNSCSIGLERGMDGMLHRVFGQEEWIDKTPIALGRTVNTETVRRRRRANNCSDSDSGDSGDSIL